MSCEKPSKPVLSPHSNCVDQQVFHNSVNTALTDKVLSRPRGRPPSNGRKRSASQPEPKPVKEEPVKRPRQRTYQRKSQSPKSATPSPVSSPIKVAPIKTSSDEEAETDKRNLHNNMERQRRIELRNAFEDLRRLVPEIEDKEKAPKVAILRQAAKYCDLLKDTQQESLARIAEMKKRQDKLRARLSFLRRSLAMTR